MKLFLQKIFERWGQSPRTPVPPAAGGLAPRLPNQLPHCEFLATRLDHTEGMFYSFVVGLHPTLAKKSD